MTAPIEKGKAGRTNYADWDKVATQLEKQVLQEEEQEASQAQASLGLNGKYARSAAEAEERVKQEQLQQTKAKLESFQQREAAMVHALEGLLDSDEEETKRSKPTTVKVTRADLPDPNKRVLVLRDTKGASIYDKIVLTNDLSQLQSNTINPLAKSYADDAENDVDPTPSTTVYGLIKVHLENLHHCTVVLESKIISGTVEIHNCSDLTIQCEATAAVATVQVDVSQTIRVEFYEAKLEPRIYHAGVSQLNVRLSVAGMRLETTADYLQDGAVAVGNATPEEFRFVTQLVQGRWMTEKVVQQSGARALTQREVDAAEKQRQMVQEKMVAMADSMISMQDKDGNPLVTKEEPVVEEVMTNGVSQVVTECQNEKAKGNEAFMAGEYGQAILLYSLSLDKSDELPDKQEEGKKQLFRRDLVLSNRAACFLKLGQHEKALEDSVRAFELEPSNIKAIFRRGLSLHAMGRYQEALPILGEAHRLEPKNKQIKQALQFAEVRMTQEMRKRQGV